MKKRIFRKEWETVLDRLFSFMQKLEQHKLYRALHGGLIMLIPVLLIGSFALALESLPIPIYITFIKTFADGTIYNFFNVVYSATFKMLSVYTTIFIGLSYGRENNNNKRSNFGSMAVALISFFIMAGIGAEDFSIGVLGAKGMFIAIVSGMCASALYGKMTDLLKFRLRLYSDGTDTKFNSAISILPPLVVTVGIFALVDAVICNLFEVSCIYDLFIEGANQLFSPSMSWGLRTVLYIFFSSCLWFFGIHGSDCLEGIAEQYFIPANAENVAAFAAGSAPQNIFTKGFLDAFVLMGGCGTTICLLVALLIFSKRHNNRLIAKAAALPMLFNINEVMVFGLPIILNPIMLIPFLSVPLISCGISYLAVSMGWVPLVCADVGWTTPIFGGGYVATDSIAGSVLQLVVLLVGTAVYAPFVRILDAQQAYIAQDYYKELVSVLQESELSGKYVHLCGLEGLCGVAARALAEDLRDALTNKKYEMYYQPQYDYKGSCVGAEALFRWNHPVYGMIYPPLAIKLAAETGTLMKLDCDVFDTVVAQGEDIKKRFGNDVKIAINVTGNTITQKEYAEHILAKYGQGAFENLILCLEVTEQTAINFNAEVVKLFNILKTMDIRFAIDDFSMGQTSIDYLKGDIFTLIKIDGSLAKGVLANSHCYEIISSISTLANSLHIEVLAEYVETEAQREALHKAGCNLYQGYLYSPAVRL